MSYTYSDYKASADYIASRIGDFKPEILMILGSGLGFIGDLIEGPLYVDYGDIPNFKTSTAPGHAGRFVFGELRGKSVAVMQGRMHCYEGYSMEDAAYPVRVLRLLGADKLLVTNAAGCINRSWNPGDIMLIDDHIRLFGFGPLWGPNVDEFGTRFPDMTKAYSPRLKDLAEKVAAAQGLTLRKGVYMYFPGPQFETPAEVRAAAAVGADAAGMSTIPEVTVAAHCGMEVLGFSLLSNMAAGITGKALSGDEVNALAEKSAGYFSALVMDCVEGM